MRIIGGRDYYDSGMALGHDEHVVFVREKDRWLPAQDAARDAALPYEALRLRYLDARTGDVVRHDSYEASLVHGGATFLVRRVTAVVCGKLHRGLDVERSASWPHPSQDRAVLWTLESLNEWLARFGLRAEDGAKEWFEREGRVRLPGYFGAKDLPPKAMDYVVANRIAVMTFVDKPAWGANEACAWRVNGDDLKDIQFYRVMDAYTLFQEIEMWVGGVLASSGNPMVEIKDDKVKAAKHGFDEWSFRKPPRTAG